jgi:transposase
MRTVQNTEMEVAAVERRLRRHRSKQERRQVAEESLQPGASVAVVARRHGVNANQVFHWRKLFREGRLDLKPTAAQLMPVRITEVIEDKSGLIHRQSGVIRIELGRVRVRVEGSVDPATLRAILEQLGR